MENDTQRIAHLEERIEAVYVSVEKVRKYLLTMMIITVVTIVLPIILAALALPFMISTLGGVYSI